ncbi:PTS mannitol transporter subunit IICBA [Nocardioides dongxiaopingii]|uniref:PTS mannitol transporter subunit IICBA n=1 Tax=Nocardioides sp. S-1144 TaxID=2582905 RepID=UPI00110EE364|nr:PTS mannitol transporter subunit IICBA [Nocardioides sp. S-1144]QCW49605.1 PTS mannitol transporter subunit IICBA [Nocardioides sp. S-1144]
MATSTTHTASSAGLRVRVQKFGTAMSNMIMPNIPALIAWGFLTALFIPDGWLPNADLATIVGPAIHYLLPVIIAATGGRMVYGDRGAVVGAFAVMGAIAGSDLLIAEINADDLAAWLADGKAEADFSPLGQIHMFLGAMILGPLSAWVMKQLDALWDGKVKAGFEMLVNQFSAGITAFVMAIVGFFAVARVVNAITDVASNIVETLVNNNLLPLTSVFIEPAKVFFLNNAINHGALTPLGIQEVSENGKSVLFLLEANPGPGLGILLAFTFFGKGLARASAPGAALIHFFGGIHEIYFPYVLMKPKLILAVVAGGATGVAVNVAFDTGLRAPASPGSIIAVFAQTAKGSYFGVALSVLASAAVTFAIASLLLKTDRAEDDGDLAAATARMEATKGRKSSVASMLTGSGTGPINSIVFACDAGMGSSAMGASVLRKKIRAAGFADVSVVNKAISNLTDDIDLVVTHQDLTARAEQRTPSAQHVSVENFMNSPRYDEIVELVKQRNDAATPAAAAPAEADAPVSADSLLPEGSLVLDAPSESRDEAITRAGALLVASGAADQAYADAMHTREASVSTYMGNLLAIPHGTNDAKSGVSRTAITFVRYAEPVDWKGKEVTFVIGIASAGNEHLKLLAKIAEIFVDPDQVARLEAAGTESEVRAILGALQPA